MCWGLYKRLKLGPMKRIYINELVKGNEYYILTEIGETDNFIYLGGDNIKLSSGNLSILISSDEIYDSNNLLFNTMELENHNENY